jgi:hypothetical protein
MATKSDAAPAAVRKRDVAIFAVMAVAIYISLDVWPSLPHTFSGSLHSFLSADDLVDFRVQL